MEHSEASAPKIVMVPDSPYARLFIELSSYAADLTEAREALELAIQPSTRGPSAADPSAYLIGFAVVAYCRTVLHSNVRKPLTEHVRIPPELMPTHETVRSFRNATIAHSQSELALTYPVGFLDRSTLEVKYVSAATMIHTLPESVVRRFRTLIEALEGLLDEAIRPVRATLEADLGRADPKVLLASPKPEPIYKLGRDFSPRTTRRPYPTSITFYLDAVDSADET